MTFIMCIILYLAWKVIYFKISGEGRGKYKAGSEDIARHTKNIKTDLRPMPSGQITGANSKEYCFVKLEITSSHVACLKLDCQIKGMKCLKT